MTFKLTYYTRRWNAKDSLRLEKTESGWVLSHMAIGGETSPDGAPFLVANLKQDNVHYPADVGRFLEVVWQWLHDREIDEARAQAMLDDLGEWISQCEQSTPKWPGWN